MKIPPEFSNQAFEAAFKRSSVIKTKQHLSSGIEKDKFLIILNKCTHDEETFVFLSTTQLEFYERNPHFLKDCLKIEANKLEFFPRDTIINCREVQTVQRSDLKKRYQEGLLKFEGELLKEMMDEIDRIVASSRFLSPYQKNIIL